VPALMRAERAGVASPSQHAPCLYSEGVTCHEKLVYDDLGPGARHTLHCCHVQSHCFYVYPNRHRAGEPAPCARCRMLCRTARCCLEDPLLVACLLCNLQAFSRLCRTPGAGGGAAGTQLQPHGRRPGGGHLRGICVMDHAHDAGKPASWQGRKLQTGLGHHTRSVLLAAAARSQAATDVRKQVNVLDNQTTGKAVDALLNYETVALFNNQVSYPWSPECRNSVSRLRELACRLQCRVAQRHW
jgi:hypothetical protein